MKTGFLLVLSLAACAALQASPAHYPRRVINGQTVDLTPLVEWWKHQSGKRPLMAWAHVTGHIVETNAYGWTVEGVIEDSSSKADDGKTASTHGKFLLKTPPSQEMNEFYQLEAKLKQSNTERDQLNRDIKSDTDREKKLNEQHPTTSRRSRSRARGTAAQLDQAKSDEHTARDRLDAVEKEIKPLEKRLAEFPDAKRYAVDCFALKLNQQFKGLPVFDHGAVLK